MAISSLLTKSSLLPCKPPSSSSYRSSTYRIPSSSSHFFSKLTCRAAAHHFPSFNRARSRSVTAFFDQAAPLYALTDVTPFEDVKFAEEIEVLDDLGGGFSGGLGGDGDDFGGSGNGGGDRGQGGEASKGDNGGESGKHNKVSGMSMSQKLTLCYAALVGVGGIMGYMKSGSQKSLAVGGGSALLLYYIYTQLPVRTAFASSLGLGLSAALLAVMGSRFKRSGKMFPAGVVSIISLIMAGGYLHGIIHALHAKPKFFNFL